MYQKNSSLGELAAKFNVGSTDDLIVNFGVSFCEPIVRVYFQVLRLMIFVFYDYS